MTVTFLSLLLIVVFLAIPAYVFYAHDIRLASAATKAVLRMMAFLVVVGVLLYLLAKCDSALLNVLFALVAVLFAALSATIRSKTPLSHQFLPVLAGTALPTLAVSALLALAVGGDAAHFTSRTFMLTTALLSGGIITPCAKGLQAYRAGLRHHAQLYYFLLGNGATRKEALSYLHRRALTATALPDLGHMALLFVGTTPLVLWSLSLAGIGVMESVVFQMLLLVATWCTAISAVLLTLLFMQHWGIDQYGRLK